MMPVTGQVNANIARREARETEMPPHWPRSPEEDTATSSRAILIVTEDDILPACECARRLALAAGFPQIDTALLTASVSRMARGMLRQESAGATRLLMQRGCRRIEADLRTRSSGELLMILGWAAR